MITIKGFNSIIIDIERYKIATTNYYYSVFLWIKQFFIEWMQSIM